MKKYLVFLAQSHPNFRKAELESLADLNGLKISFESHTEDHPFMIVDIENDKDAEKLISRCILSKAIYELWGEGKTIPDLHESVQGNYKPLIGSVIDSTFKFEIFSFQGGKRSKREQIKLINEFQYLNFNGKISLDNPMETYCIFERYSLGENLYPLEIPDWLYFGRLVGTSLRSKGIIEKFDIKNRPYYGTTSFDPELSLVTCNIGQVAPNKVTYDPFVGTGSFILCASEFKSLSMGSDIDFRTIKGKNDKSHIDNCKMYGSNEYFLDSFCMDFTNDCLRKSFKIDTIICDPPYGVREGLKVCGHNNPDKYIGREKVEIDGELAYLRKDYIQPKKSYSLDLLLDDLLEFSSQRLPLNGRLAFWMPVANDEDIPTLIPMHKNLELIYELVQDFNKWSRRLLVYVKRGDDYKGETILSNDRVGNNNFRARYFDSFSKNSRDKPEY